MQPPKQSILPLRNDHDDEVQLGECNAKASTDASTKEPKGRRLPDSLGQDPKTVIAARFSPELTEISRIYNSDG